MSGKSGLTFHPDGKPYEFPLSLSGIDISATYYDGNGEPHVYPGEGTADGRFTIADVPEAPVDLSIAGSTHVVTDARSLDLGFDQAGRDGWLIPATGTELVFDVDGMTAWSSEHELGLFSSNLGLHHPFLTFDAVAEVPLDATALTDYAVSWEFWPLVEGAEGDRAILVHYGIHRKPVSGELVLIATQSLELESFDQIDGAATPLTGSFTTLPKTESLDLEWAFSTFSAMRGRVHPDAGSLFANFEIYAQPGGIESEIFTLGPMLMRGYSYEYANNINLGTIEYGNPFPEEWPVFIIAYTTFFTELTDSSGTLSTFAFGDLFYSADLETYGDGPIALQVPPVGDLRIGGRTAYGFPGGFGTTPLVSWNGPGAATGYEILLAHVYDVGGETDYDFLARFTTTETEFRFPPDLLVEGEYYYIIVSAIHMPDVDLSRAPFRNAMIRGRADAISDLFTP